MFTYFFYFFFLPTFAPLRHANILWVLLFQPRVVATEVVVATEQLGCIAIGYLLTRLLFTPPFWDFHLPPLIDESYPLLFLPEYGQQGPHPNLIY